MRDSRLVCAATSVAVCLALVQARPFAHHGTNISYDRTMAIVVKGVVTEFWYKNPHPALFVDVMDKDGKTTRWTIEIAPTPYSLARAGWTKNGAEEALKAGTPVSVSLYPSRAGTPSGLLQRATGADGTDILGGANAN